MQDLFAKLMQNQSFLFEKDVKSCFAQKKKKRLSFLSLCPQQIMVLIDIPYFGIYY